MTKGMTAMIGKAAFAVALLASVSAARAEPPLGSRLGDRLRPSAEQLDEETSARHGHELAQCLVGKRGSAATRLLAQASDADYRKAYKKLMSGELQCYSGFDGGIAEARKVRIPRDVLRGMLAEQMVKTDRRSVAQLPALPRQRVYQRPWFAVTGRDSAVDEMATCVAEVDPAHTIALLDTRPYSGEERAAFGTLVPAMGPCLRIGTKMTANRQALRAALAEALYQRTQPWVMPAEAQSGAAK